MKVNKIIECLNKFWEIKDCKVLPSYDMKMGAGTFAPITFFNILKQTPINVAFVQPCRRYADYGCENSRCKYLQYQIVMMKPLYYNEEKVESIDNKLNYARGEVSILLVYLGVNIKRVDFKDDAWRSDCMGAFGTGFEVLVDGVEVCQVTCFNKFADQEVQAIEITFGIERLCMVINGLKNLNDIEELEQEYPPQLISEEVYKVRNSTLEKFIDTHTDNNIGALYDAIIEMSDNFNLVEMSLDHSTRVSYIKKIRQRTKFVAELFLKTMNDPIKKEFFQKLTTPKAPLTLQEEFDDLKKIYYKVGWFSPKKDPMGIKKKVDNIINLFLVVDKSPNIYHFLDDDNYCFNAKIIKSLKYRFYKMLRATFGSESTSRWVIDSVFNSFKIDRHFKHCHIKSIKGLITFLNNNRDSFKYLVNTYKRVINILDKDGEITLNKKLKYAPRGVLIENVSMENIDFEWKELLMSSNKLNKILDSSTVIKNGKVVNEDFINVGFSFINQLTNIFKPEDFYPILKVV